MFSSAKCSLPILAALLLASCSPARKMESVRSGAYAPSLALADESVAPDIDTRAAAADTMMVKDSEGRDLIIMKAVRDENGEMVASDVILPSVVVAKFRNVAERHGKVDLRFDINVPAALIDGEWQLRLTPLMEMLGERFELDPVYITGARYRAAQLRGYERYERFVGSIITDTTLFVNIADLEIFLKRNLPELYAFRSDTSHVSDEQWRSAFGVTGAEAVEHYTDHLRRRLNSRKAGRREEMFRRYVKSPIRTESLRLDTLIASASGDLVYSYVQTISTRPGLRKVDVSLCGSVYKENKCIYTIPQTDRITYYISSLSTLADDHTRYISRIVERSVQENSSCYIEFESGKAEVLETMGHNASEMGRIKSNIREILGNKLYDLDSIVISAFASPEGSCRENGKLALRRANAASGFFRSYTMAVRDSLCECDSLAEIAFVARNGGENWRMLDWIMCNDSLICRQDSLDYQKMRSIADPDRREHAMHGLSSYRYLRESVYPRLRVVRFDFHLHRRGMVKDTIHTTEVDSVYMQGLEAIRNRDYELALSRLAPYRDFNTAVAFAALDRNHSALAILDDLEANPKVNYMKAVLNSRLGDYRGAVKCYLAACSADRSMVFRGSLDPEIATLVKKYNLNLFQN